MKRLWLLFWLWFDTLFLGTPADAIEFNKDEEMPQWKKAQTKATEKMQEENYSIEQIRENLENQRG